MGILDFLKPKTEADEITRINGEPVKVVEVGSSGTEIYGGYLSEEYLSELTGRTWADTVDKMRRSDGNVIMTLRALKLPLKSSNWYLNTKEKSEEAELQKKLLEKAIFEDTGRSFTKLLGEILTMLDFGYSLFEITFKPKLNDPELGHYNTLKSIAYRSQRTIERWNIDKGGNVISVTQLANGDTGKNVDMDARFLIHFSPDQEGDNFEGISVLRGMYGSWLRKNHFLKLLAAGIEKYAIPIPTLEVPPGKENSEEYKSAIRALKAYTSNQSNYITFPQGWKIDIKTTTFESEKVRSTIDFENKEMVNSILAAFLLLGQGSSSGNRALGDTLSDFFAQTLQYVADHIAEQFQEKIFKPLIKMNFGDRPCLVELRCDGLDEKADKAWAETIKTLTDAGVVTKDNRLEVFIREKFKLPEREEGVEPTQPDPQNVTLAEKKSSKSASKQREASKLIRESAGALSGLFKAYLSMMGTQFIEGMIAQKSKASTTNEIKAANKVDITVPSDYREGVRALLSFASVDARGQVRQLFPKSKKLSEFRLAQTRDQKIIDRRQKLESAAEDLISAIDQYVNNPTSSDLKSAMNKARAAFEEQAKAARTLIEDGSIPFAEAQKNLAKTDLLLDSQVADLKKGLGLQFQTSLPSTDSDDTIRGDLQERLDQIVSGPIVNTGPDIIMAQTINDARLDEAREEGGDEIESYTFIGVDDDRQTEICSELSGRTFAPNDPDLDRYTPPLHHNCRSYLAVNLKSFKGNPAIDDDKIELSKAAQRAITLSEGGCCSHDEEPTSEPEKYVLDLVKTLRSVKF